MVRTSKIPPFFRRSYIVGGYAWSRNVRKEVVVHGLYFCFWHEKQEIDEVMEEEVENAWHDETIYMGNPTVTKSGWEMAQVKSDEAVGVGFYRLVILVNDERVKEIDFRH